MEGSHQQRRRLRRRPSWVCTFLVQASLCIALYGALNIGRPRIPRNGNESGNHRGRPPGRYLDLYFMSVGGGPRPLEQQEQLLRQMENVASIYKAEFIVNLSEQGENDPLMQNATLRFPSLRVPWYATAALVEQGRGYFLRQFKMPHDQSLDIICLDTGLWQGPLPNDGQSNTRSDQLHWLSRTLAMTSSNWRIVVGFHSLDDCEEKQGVEKMNFHEHLRSTFMKYKVNVYLSNQDCGGRYTREEGITYIQNPIHGGKSCLSHAVKNGSEVTRETCDGFHLHRISPLEMESYFINSAGDIISISTVHQWGREDM